MFEDFKTVIIDMGDAVICDFCNKDWTDEKGSGGFLFESKAVCPNCAPAILKNIEKYHEENFIRGVCPDNMPFGDWVRSIR